MHEPRQDVIVQRRIGGQLFKSTVFLSQLAYLANFDRAKSGVLLASCVESRIGNAELPAHIIHRRAFLCQFQGIGNLILDKSRTLFGPLLDVVPADSETNLFYV